MKPVSLQAVVDEMDVFSDEMTACINKKTGELFTIGDEMARMIEREEEDDAFVPDWQKEILPKVREVMESDDFVALPDKFEIHEYSIMENFCYSMEDAGLQEKLLSTIHGRGAFSRFKDSIHRKSVQEDWYRFRTDALKKIAADFLESEGIAFVDERT